MIKRRASHILFVLFRTLLIACICYTILFPLFTKVLVAFMQEKDLYDPTVKYIPKHVTLGNFRSAVLGLNYFKALINSLLLSLGVGLLTLISVTLIGYGFARFRFPLKNVWFFLVMATLVVPPATILLPQYIMFQSWKVLSTPLPILLLSAFGVGTKEGLFIYQMRQCFRSIPKELEEAAYIDGAGVGKAFVHVVLPSARPMMTAVFLFAFVWQWTDTTLSGTFMSDADLLSIKLMNLANQVYGVYAASGGGMGFVSPGFTSLLNNAGSVLVILPLFVIYIFCQRYFIEGIERSGLTG